MKRNLSKTSSIIVITLIYLLALAIGCLVFRYLKVRLPEIWALFVADVVATIIVWGFGLVYKNVSVYDQVKAFEGMSFPRGQAGKGMEIEDST